MDSSAVQLTAMNIKISLILALSTFVSCDEFCENGDGDFFWINNPVINYTITDPEVSPMGTFKQKLWVDNHNYSLQLRVPATGRGEDEFRIYYKEGIQSGEELEIEPTKMLNLVKKYGYKEFNFQRVLGYQRRTKRSPDNPDVSCFHYRCASTVTNKNCNLTANTPSCEVITLVNPSNFTPADGRNIFFFDQCAMKLTPVTGNIFHIWINSAFSKGLPTITVLAKSVKLDWGEAASKFPEGTLH